MPLGLQSTGSCPVFCPPDLNLVGQTVNGVETFEAAGKVTTQNVTFAAGSVVTIVAGQAVEFGDLTSIHDSATIQVIVDPSALTCTPMP